MMTILHVAESQVLSDRKSLHRKDAAFARIESILLSSHVADTALSQNKQTLVISHSDYDDL